MNGFNTNDTKFGDVIDFCLGKKKISLTDKRPAIALGVVIWMLEAGWAISRALEQAHLSDGPLNGEVVGSLTANLNVPTAIFLAAVAAVGGTLVMKMIKKPASLPWFVAGSLGGVLVLALMGTGVWPGPTFGCDRWGMGRERYQQ